MDDDKPDNTWVTVVIVILAIILLNTLFNYFMGGIPIEWIPVFG